jgi:hypothetical protein
MEIAMLVAVVSCFGLLVGFVSYISGYESGHEETASRYRHEKSLRINKLTDELAAAIKDRDRHAKLSESLAKHFLNSSIEGGRARCLIADIAALIEKYDAECCEREGAE